MKNRYSNTVGTALCGCPSKQASDSGATACPAGERRGVLLNTFSFLRRQESISLLNLPNWIPISTGMTQSELKGRLGRILYNSRGISVLFLVFAMLLMVTIGYVFSYLIPAKQKSVRFPIYSTQAFFIAQSGVEYAVFYSSDKGWRSTTDLLRLNNPGVNQRNLGNGGFTINYSNVTDILTSTGQITGLSENRVIRVSNFTAFLRLLFEPPAPCWVPGFGTRRIRIYFRNVRSDVVTLRSFSATWTQTVVRRITRFDMNLNGGAFVQKYGGIYFSGGAAQNFNAGGNSQTVNSNDVVGVIIRWNGNLPNNSIIVINFYTGVLGTGERYTFNLNPDGAVIPTCPP